MFCILPLSYDHGKSRMYTLAIVDAQKKYPKQNTVITMVQINLTVKKQIVKRSGKKSKCKTNLRGAGALVYLPPSFSATKGRNSCAAGVRPDAPLFQHQV